MELKVAKQIGNVSIMCPVTLNTTTSARGPEIDEYDTVYDENERRRLAEDYFSNGGDRDDD